MKYKNIFYLFFMFSPRNKFNSLTTRHLQLLQRSCKSVMSKT